MRNSTLPQVPPARVAGTEAASIRTTEVLHILRSAGGALLVQAVLHGQLLRVEWAQEKSRLLRMAMAALLGLVCLLGLMTALGMLLLAIYWDTPYRVRAVSVLVALYALGVAIVWRLLKSQEALASDSFAATRSELAADLELLRGHP